MAVTNPSRAQFQRFTTTGDAPTIGQPGAIGFLVAAKSILRFEEAKKQKLAEYVLIGTLLSFTLAMALSYLTLQAAKL